MKIITFLVFTLFAGNVLASMPVNPSYVSSDGSGASCTIEAPCALSYANSNASAGDTVYLRAGTYTITGNGIDPTNSGSAGNPITFSGYQSEVINIAGDASATGKSSRGIDINGNNYIKVTKMNFLNMYQGLTINNGDYNEISYCTFTFRDAWAVGENGVYTYDPAGIDIGGNSDHNWIHHNSMSGCGGFDSSDQGVLFAIGATQLATPESNNNNTIEFNHIYHGGHHVLGVNYGKYNVVRRNYMHNEGWFDDSAYDAVCSSGDNGVCGYRVIYSMGSTDYAGSTLYEGNTVGYAGQYGRHHVASGGPGGGINVANDDNIIRYNQLIGNVQYGVAFSTSLSSPVKDGENNAVYNNTFFQNGHNWITYLVAGNDDDGTGADLYRTDVVVNDDTNVAGNIFKNNLFHDSWALTNKRFQSVYYPQIVAGTANNISDNTYENNFTTDATYISSATPFTNTADPLFVSEGLPDDSAEIVSAWSNYTLTTPNLSLTSGSPAIDQGSYLTQASGSGNSSTTLIVDNALYFQDGTWGSDLADLSADYISIGTVSNIVQISSINYSTNTIILASAMTWADNAGIWLYKKSDGGVVLLGAAPEYGANEYNPTHQSIRAGTGSATSGTGMFYAR